MNENGYKNKTLKQLLLQQVHELEILFMNFIMFLKFILKEMWSATWGIEQNR